MIQSGPLQGKIGQRRNKLYWFKSLKYLLVSGRKVPAHSKGSLVLSKLLPCQNPALRGYTQSNSCSPSMASEPLWAGAEGAVGTWPLPRPTRALVQCHGWSCSSLAHQLLHLHCPPGKAPLAVTFQPSSLVFFPDSSLLFTLSATQELAEPWQDSSWQLELFCGG